MRVNANNGRELTSREILEEAGQGELTDDDYRALDILIYYSDAFYSLPSWEDDGRILMMRLELALTELSTALAEMDTEGWFQALDVNDDDIVTWEEMIPYIETLCDPGDFDIALFEPLPEAETVANDGTSVVDPDALKA